MADLAAILPSGIEAWSEFGQAWAVFVATFILEDLATIGAGILALTAGEMIVQDGKVASLLSPLPFGRWIGWGIVLAVVAGVVSCPRWLGKTGPNPPGSKAG